jgi:uncharacterized membrane protein
MSELIAITYADQGRAAEVLAELRRLQAEKLIDIDDVCTVTWDSAGKIDLHQTLNTSTLGVVGALWGTLVGALFLAPLVGIVVAVATGGLGGRLTEYGVEDRFLRSLGRNLLPGSSALFIATRGHSPNRLMPVVRGFGGTIMYTPLASDAEARLCDRLKTNAAASVN